MLRCRPVMLSLLAAPALALLLQPAAAADADTVVARVNDTEITLGQMAAMKLGLPAELDQMPEAELWDLMLDQMIRQAALAEAGEQTATTRDRATLEIDRRAYLAGAALERIAAPEPTEAEIRAVYERAFPSDKPVTEYDADHILLETPEAAQAVIEALAAGEDFGKLAEERSVDAASAVAKGDLGWFPLDRMVKEFADAVAGMEKGETSKAPVKSQFGYHVIKFNDSRVKVAPEMAAIRDQLIQQVRRERVEAEIDRLVSAAEIERSKGLDASLLSEDVLGVE